MREHDVLAPRESVPLRQTPPTRALDRLRTHPLESVLIAISVLILLFTTIVTIRVATGGESDGGDLTFTGTLDELALALSNGGPDQLATLERATLHTARGTVTTDTIAIIADPDDEPAVAPGGFIADHVRLYNDHAVRQALVQATLGATSSSPFETDAPSLLRTVRTENGERQLSGRPNPFLLTVRSPYAERAWREVRTADWSSSGSMLGLAGDIALSPSTPDGATARLNGRDCVVRRNDGRFLLYCGGSLASDAGRFFDVAFEPNPSNPLHSPARAALYRPGTLWRNGSSLALTEDAVAAGDVFDVERTGPFMLSVSQRGALAVGQWINGRPTFSNQRLGTISFFSAAGRSGSGASDTLVLSLDAGLSHDLENAAREFVDARPMLRRMTAVVMDVRTGELKAVVEPARESDAEPLLAFEPLLVGSVVKPLVAAAILARQPQLAEMTLRYAGDTVRAVASIPLESGFANAANGCTQGIAFADFIRCSSNQYAAELLVRSLRNDGFQPTDGSSVVPRDVLEGSSIGAGLAEAFDVDALAGRTAGRNPGLWSAAMAPTGTTDRTLLPWESRPWLVFPETDGTRFDLLARYAFGGWENRWTLLSLGEAYARVATGREVRARIVRDSTTAPAMPDHVTSAFARVRSALRQVPATGTATGLASDVQRVMGSDLEVLAKTGTLNEQRDRFRSLALVLGREAAGSDSGALACGVVVITYFDFRDDAGGRGPRAALPPVHLEFARTTMTEVLRRHWDRVSGCDSASDGAEQ